MRKVFEAVSLYDYAVILILFMMALILQNLYVLVLVLALMSKDIPEALLKSIDWKYNKRPKGAFNCNALNSGGEAEGKPGFPSGHTALAVMLAAILLIEYYKQHQYQPRAQAVIIAVIFAILVPISRVQMKCHTVIQVIAGALLGIMLALIFTCVIDPLLCKIDRYSTDKAKFYDIVFKTYKL